MIQSWFSGFTLGLSLILAIGAQNAFVLKQGLTRHHVFMVCLICAVSDAMLIVLGVSGFGVLVKEYPSIELVSRYAGAAFLTVYGIKSLISAVSTTHALKPEGEILASRMSTALTCLAFTWLNPHVYLDTVVLMGSISTQYEATIMAFTSGAVTASFVFFFALGYGARILVPVFQKPVSWKILEGIIAVVMFLIAYSLVSGLG